MDLDKTVTAVFNTEMDAGTVNGTTFTLTDSSGAPVAGTVSCSGITAVFQPADTLLIDEEYTVSLTSSIENQSGVAMGYDHVVSFRGGLARVKYYPNGAESGTAPVDGSLYNREDTATVAGNTGGLERSGYLFTGWNTEADGSGSTYAEGEIVEIVDTNITLYALWTTAYSVTYNGNGATGGSVPVDGNLYLYGDNVTVLGNPGGLERSGYLFSGWNTEADGSGTTYGEGDTVAISGSNVILYALWTTVYSVTYDGNGATGGTVPVDGNLYLYGESATVLGNIGSLINGELYFAGWNTEADGSGTGYGTGDTLEISNADVTLYALWTVDPFVAADTPGDIAPINIGSETVNMIYANNQTGITFPFSPSSWTSSVDNIPATLTRKFFMSDTQVTNALMAEVLQWAYDNGKFSTTLGDHNGLESRTVKYGGQELLDLDDTNIKINYSSGNFTLDSGYEDHPVVCVTWYGAIMFCNWLTEMRDGNTDNVVYTGIDTDWDHTETVENADRSGYRLPSSQEWEYAARYIGTTAPTGGDLATEYIAQSYNSGDVTLTAGYYWTPADYASGAIRDYTNDTETRAVGWYSGDPDMGGSDTLMPVAQKTANQLGLYDMSGNVWEWCFTVIADGHVFRGGSWSDTADYLQVGYWSFYSPNDGFDIIGFRFARSAP